MNLSFAACKAGAPGQLAVIFLRDQLRDQLQVQKLVGEGKLARILKISTLK